MLSNTLVSIALHLISIYKIIPDMGLETIVNIIMFYILLSMWDAGLLVHCVEILGLDYTLLCDCLGYLSAGHNPAASTIGDASVAIPTCASRTLSTDSLDSMETLDTVTSTIETSGMLNSTTPFTLGCNEVQDAFQDIDFKLLLKTA